MPGQRESAIRHWRRAAGLTQEELAERAGLSVRTIRELESGRTERPYRSTVESVAAALDLNDAGTSELLRTTRASPAPQEGSPWLVPAQLPWGVAHFTGRTEVQRRLDDLLTTANRPGQLVISVLTGMPGVGKTEMATHWAHRVAHRFGDGQLFANLAGRSGGPPAEPADVLRGFLRALGVDDGEQPETLAELAARYRSALAGRRVLVLLDDARSAAQVRPLLPNSPTCLVLVTSRHSLSGLVVRDGARQVTLDCLPKSDAVLLLGRIIGAHRVGAEPHVAAQLAELCGCLPLALRAVAERAVRHPDRPLRDLAAELADPQRCLDVMDTPDDPASALRTLLSWSYDALGAATASVFRLLSVHETAPFDVTAAARVTGSSSVDQMRGHLQVLADAHLLESPAPSRYRFHPLVCRYAAERRHAEESPQAVREATRRMVAGPRPALPGCQFTDAVRWASEQSYQAR